MGQSAGYSESALKRYNEAIDRYTDEVRKNAGEGGFAKSLEMGKQGAMAVSGEAQRQATNAARASGLNKYQAAALGANQAANAYNQNFLQQQGQASNQLGQLLSGFGQSLGARGQSAGQAANINAIQNQAQANNMQNAINTIGTVASIAAMMSDERAKDAEKLTPEKTDITKEMAKIDAYLFKYKPKIQNDFTGEKGVDDKAHVGVMAQELASNPVTEGAVEEGEEGYLEVDPGKLCMALTAVTSDMAKKMGELEYELKMLKGANNG